MPKGVSGIAVAVIAIGGIFAWSGLRGKSIANTARLIIAGKDPTSSSQTNAVTGATITTDASGNQEPNLAGGTTNATTGTYQAFFTDVLNGIGAPASEGNLLALASIVNFEGKNSYFNPFNIENRGSNDPTKGVGNFNDVGVQIYGSYQQGVSATTYLLKEPHWSGVRLALMTGSFSLVTQAITTAYTWAKFRVASQSTLSEILASPMGS